MSTSAPVAALTQRTEGASEPEPCASALSALDLPRPMEADAKDVDEDAIAIGDVCATGAGLGAETWLEPGLQELSTSPVEL